MALLKFLPSVKTPKVVIIAAAVVNAATLLKLPDMVCTSGNDSVHMKGSKHYTDEAADFRVHHLSDEERVALVLAVKNRLGRDYDVIIEDLGKPNAHMHVEHDPTR